MTDKEKIPLKQKIFLWFGDHVIGNFIRLLKKSVKLTVVGEENLKRTLEENDGKAIFAFWHGNMVIPMMKHIGEGVLVLVSEHGDGEIIAKVLKSLGYGLVRGSTTRGGPKAMKEMFKLMKHPNIIGITPDGPKGPYRELKIGTVLVSQRTGIPILPMSAYTNKPAFLKSWDKFHVVKPFSHCVLMYGEPVKIERDISGDDLEEERERVEKAIQKLDETAEAYFKSNSDLSDHLK
ncbi:lysophospholipid acyltransferase family protein [candidate division KSB1 bacterium]